MPRVRSRQQLGWCVAIAAALLCNVALASRYELTTAIGSTARGHWATYDDEVHLGTVSPLSNVDDALVLESINFTIPFFDLGEIQLYIDTNGLISATPWPKCRAFCRFGPRYSSTDGEWAAVALFFSDLNPAQALDSRIYQRHVRNKYGDNQTIAQVEFRSVPEYGRAASEARLTAQAEFFRNGTVILRYRGVITGVNATVGMMFTEELSATAPSPTSPLQGLTTAYRFERVPTACDAATTCGACSNSEGCAWCGAMSKCLTAATATAYCASDDLYNASSGCTPYAASPTNPDVQVFYHQHYARDANTTLSTSFPNRRSIRVVGYALYPLSLEPSFSFPFFDFPKGDPGRVNLSRRITVHSYGSISVGDELCTRMATTCPRSSIYPLVSTGLAADFWGSWVHTVDLPQRRIGDLMCTTANAGPDGTCAEGFMLEIAGLLPNEVSPLPYINITVQTVIDSSGTIAFRVARVYSRQHNADLPASNDALVAVTPRMENGVVRDSVSDGSSSMVPPSAVRLGWMVAFKPVRGCPNCGGHGACNTTTGVCMCDNRTQGYGCRDCRSGFYGPDCAACPECSNGGQCDDGSAGSGQCRCVDPWSGPTCTVRCADDDPRPLNCPNCDATGGTCLCGRCSCRTALGWYGDNCDRWDDPCTALSLDGCSACVTQRGVRCQYCAFGEYKCVVQAAQSGIPLANATDRCNLQTFTLSDVGRCPNFKYPATGGETSGTTLLVIIAVFTAIGFIICIGVFFMWCCRPLPMNPMITEAHPGIVRVVRSRREREIVPVTALPRTENGMVLAIPLRQINIKELYERQTVVSGEEADSPVHAAKPAFE